MIEINRNAPKYGSTDDPSLIYLTTSFPCATSNNRLSATSDNGCFYCLLNVIVYKDV